MNWYASDRDKVKVSESSFKNRKTTKLTCSFQQTYSIWPMLPACNFLNKQLQKGSYTDVFTTAWRAEISTNGAINKEQMFAGGLGSEVWIPSDMIFWNAEQPTVVSDLCRIPEYSGSDGARASTIPRERTPGYIHFIVLLPVLWSY